MKKESVTENTSKLYVVATPIGNRGDITLRALDVLKSVDLVISEDTRVAGKLLSMYEISKKVIRGDEASAESAAKVAIEYLSDGKSVAFLSDAGTPGISDPGAQVVRIVTSSGYDAVPLPGASALASAFSVSGFFTDSFVFLGFPPHKKGRKSFFEELAAEKRSIVFFESPHRVLKTLESLSETIADREVCVCRELTKMHEEIVRGSAEIALKHFQNHPDRVRGEFVIVINRQARK